MTLLYTDCSNFYRVSTVSAERIAAPFRRYVFENTTVLLLTVGGLPHYHHTLETYLDHRLPR